MPLGKGLSKRRWLFIEREEKWWGARKRGHWRGDLVSGAGRMRLTVSLGREEPRIPVFRCFTISLTTLGWALGWGTPKEGGGRPAGGDYASPSKEEWGRPGRWW